MKKEMSELKHPYVGSEHLLLAILHNKDLSITKELSNIDLSYEKFKEELSVEELEELKLKYEKLYKTDREDYLKNFKMYTLIEVVLIIMEALSMDRVKQLSLSNEEIKIAAQELYEHWV